MPAIQFNEFGNTGVSEDLIDTQPMLAQPSPQFSPTSPVSPNLVSSPSRVANPSIRSSPRRRSVRSPSIPRPAPQDSSTERSRSHRDDDSSSSFTPIIHGLPTPASPHTVTHTPAPTHTDTFPPHNPNLEEDGVVHLSPLHSDIELVPVEPPFYRSPSF